MREDLPQLFRLSLYREIKVAERGSCNFYRQFYLGGIGLISVLVAPKCLSLGYRFCIPYNLYMFVIVVKLDLFQGFNVAARGLSEESVVEGFYLRIDIIQNG